MEDESIGEQAGPRLDTQSNLRERSSFWSLEAGALRMVSGQMNEHWNAGELCSCSWSSWRTYDCHFALSLGSARIIIGQCGAPTTSVALQKGQPFGRSLEPLFAAMATATKWAPTRRPLESLRETTRVSRGILLSAPMFTLEKECRHSEQASGNLQIDTRNTPCQLAGPPTGREGSGIGPIVDPLPGR